jgi:glycosyltransferase involved in cell wall biosynthesis
MHSFMFTSNLWGRVGAILAGIPVRIAAERNVDDWKGPIRRWLDRRLAPWTSKVVAVSGKVEEFCRDRIGIPDEKLVTIRNGISVDRFKPLYGSREASRAALGVAPGDLVVTQVARLVPQKGYDVLLKAAGLVRRRYPRIRLMIVGEGPSREALAAQAEHLGIGQAISFLGFRKNVREVLWATDIFVLASWREGLPVSLLEAMAASLPSVVTSVGGNDEAVVEGETGFLVPPGDVVLMADRINRLLDDRALRERMGTAAFKRVESEFSAERMVRETEALYDRCLEKA